MSTAPAGLSLNSTEAAAAAKHFYVSHFSLVRFHCSSAINTTSATSSSSSTPLLSTTSTIYIRRIQNGCSRGSHSRVGRRDVLQCRHGGAPSSAIAAELPIIWAAWFPPRKRGASCLRGVHRRVYLLGLPSFTRSLSLVPFYLKVL